MCKIVHFARYVWYNVEIHGDNKNIINSGAIRNLPKTMKVNYEI